MVKSYAFKLVLAIFLIITVMVVAVHAQNPRSGNYLIGAGDMLEIVTWKEPELSREEVLVRIDGYISFPLLNDAKAAGLTTAELTKNIQNSLKDFIANPVVTVTVRSPASKRFYILGEVVNTGEYPLIKRLTVLQAFAIAGGFTEWASKKEIILMRQEAGEEKIYRVNYRDIVKGRDVAQNIPIQADDTIVVP
ncbi:MAG: polysaccharide biosynthesis/export family protein [Desulfobacterales bacterium]